MNNKDVPVIIYLRSAATVEGPGYSIEEQEQLCRDYCNKHGLKVERIFKDEDFSSMDMHRPGLIEAIIHCQGGGTMALVVVDLSRLARDYDLLETIKETFNAHGVEILTVGSEYGSSNPDEVSLEGVQSLFATHERDKLVKRLEVGRYLKSITEEKKRNDE